jgi:hypothetical protein
MLAQTQLTPAELKVTDKEFTGLVTVLGQLERGELKHAFAHPFWAQDGSPPTGNCFNMGITGQVYECGTVGCIGGWAALAMDMKPEDLDFYVSESRSISLQPLYYPDEDEGCGEIDVDYTTITPEQASQAIRNFLATGKPQWAEILA